MTNDLSQDWQVLLFGLSVDLRDLLPNIHLHDLLESCDDVNAAADQVRITMWRLRGMRDAADLLMVVDQRSEQRRAAKFLSVQSEKAFAVCSDALKTLDGLGAKSRSVPAPEWVPSAIRELHAGIKDTNGAGMGTAWVRAARDRKKPKPKRKAKRG